VSKNRDLATANDDLAQAAGGTSDPFVGRSIGDRYTIVGLLGSGGMGKVYEARHTTLARRFAIKFLQPRYAGDRDVLRRFENEAKAAGGLEHPNLVAVTDFGRMDDDAPYLVMEFLQGEDCAKLLRRIGPLPPSRAAGIVLQACRGLTLAHDAQIVHRDLKPENLFLTDAGDGTDLVKILDFGIAKLRTLDTDVDTSATVTMGTAHYMSPEQVRATSAVDHRTDIWSLGVVLYELLSGRQPFTGKEFLPVVYRIVNDEPPPLALAEPGTASALVDVTRRALAKDPAERYQSAAEFAEALFPFAARSASTPPGASVVSNSDVPTLVTPEGGSSGVRRTLALPRGRVADRRRGFVVAIGGIALLGLALTVFSVRRPTHVSEAAHLASTILLTSAAGDSVVSPPRESTPAPALAPEPSPNLESIPKRPVRTVSEHFEHGASGPLGSASGSRSSPKSATASGGSAAPTASSVPKPPQPVTIDTANPF
jgi:serine/threonine-protein kinase